MKYHNKIKYKNLIKKYNIKYLHLQLFRELSKLYYKKYYALLSMFLDDAFYILYEAIKLWISLLILPILILGNIIYYFYNLRVWKILLYKVLKNKELEK